MNNNARGKVEMDYGVDGIDIQTAMIRHAKTYPDVATRPKCILWNGQSVWTSFDLIVPETGVVRIDFISKPTDPAQGVDIKIEGGGIELSDGKVVQTLRTWHEEKYEKSVFYRYKSSVRLIKVWNVYRRGWPDGRVTEEKWTGNAGFLVEERDDGVWMFRCSGGLAKSPDFHELIFCLSVNCLSD